MKTTIELDENDLREILTKDVFPAFAAKHNIPIKDSFGCVVFISSPVDVTSEKFKGDVLMAFDSVKLRLHKIEPGLNVPHVLPEVPKDAWLSLKEIWPGKFFILLCAEWQ